MEDLKISVRLWVPLSGGTGGPQNNLSIPTKGEKSYSEVCISAWAHGGEHDNAVYKIQRNPLTVTKGLRN